MLDRVLELKQRIRAGETVFGAWLTIPDIVVAEIVAGAGFDFVFIDGEHSPWTIKDIRTALVAFKGTKTVPMARIPWNDHVFIKQALDVGIEGIMAPMVRTAEEARALVAACRYPPVGTRGFGPQRASDYFRDIDRYMEQANDGILIMPQFEDIAAMKELDLILDVPGIDVLCIGPTDLSGSLGVLRQTRHPSVTAVVDEVFAKARAKGMPICNGMVLSPEEQGAWIENGTRMIFAAQDSALLVTQMAKALKAAREAHRP